jgi:hypothetical protein
VAAGGGRPGGASTPTRDGTSIRTYLPIYIRLQTKRIGSDPEVIRIRK